MVRRASLLLALIVFVGIGAMRFTSDPVGAAVFPTRPWNFASHGSSSCPVTEPNGNMPPGSGNVGGYGNDALWTNVWMWGEGPVPVKADPAEPGRTHGPGKWAWYRYVPGELTIEGRRLDGDAPPLNSWIPDGYGSNGFQVSGLSFPTPGCWEVTGRVGEESLTFVVLVVEVDSD